mmetsp:Transcript_6816/g.21458  ORF Transcript_6816/g.21458 Transcript_6816/m.21458 type:complete len:228 (+) Transcript_6816:1378-2061(+)
MRKRRGRELLPQRVRRAARRRERREHARAERDVVRARRAAELEEPVAGGRDLELLRVREVEVVVGQRDRGLTLALKELDHRLADRRLPAALRRRHKDDARARPRRARRDALDPVVYWQVQIVDARGRHGVERVRRRCFEAEPRADLGRVGRERRFVRHVGRDARPNQTLGHALDVRARRRRRRAPRLHQERRREALGSGAEEEHGCARCGCVCDLASIFERATGLII